MGEVRRRSVWPVWAGAALVVAGLAGGLLAPVGEFCSAPFLPQDEAGRADSASAVAMTLTTRYRAVCTAAAGQQAFAWWSLVWLGVAVALIGVVSRFGRLPENVARRARRAAVLLWSGLLLVFAGAVGGRVVPMGELCSGPFGDNEAARAALSNGGSSRALVACQAAAPSAAPLWWAAIVVGMLLFAVGLVVALWPARAAVRAARRERAAVLGGLFVLAAAILCGMVIPTGPNCSGAFFPEGPSNLTSHTCSPLHSNQVGRVCWTLAALGAAFAVAGFAAMILNSRRTSEAMGRARPMWMPTTGLAASTAGLLGGLLVPVGPHCSGAFVVQYAAIEADFSRPLRELAANGSYFAQCNAVTAPVAGLWWTLIAVGFAVFSLGFVHRRARTSAMALTGTKPQAMGHFPAQGIAQDLSVLADLRDRGALTAEEFETQKQRLLRS